MCSQEPLHFWRWPSQRETQKDPEYFGSPSSIENVEDDRDGLEDPPRASVGLNCPERRGSLWGRVRERCVVPAELESAETGRAPTRHCDSPAQSTTEFLAPPRFSTKASPVTASSASSAIGQVAANGYGDRVSL